jgi:methyltransferase family protein
MIRQHAPGRSFADVGAMWGIHGALSFLAEESGATSVTAVDMMPATEEFQARHAEQGSKIRFVNGDLHDPAVLEEVGKHDVVFCAGVLYHAPNPIHTLECLAQITGDTLLLLTAAIPEIPGVENGCVFYPGLSPASRKLHAPATEGPRLGITHPFQRKGSEREEHGAGKSGTYDNWWWGITPSALGGMLEATGFEVLEMGGEPFHARAVARLVDP